MRTQLTRLRFWVIGPFLFYLLCFLLWFPRWQHTPHAFVTRALGLVFGAMTAVLISICIVGAFYWHFGWLVDIVVQVYETYIRKDSGHTLTLPISRCGSHRATPRHSRSRRGSGMGRPFAELAPCAKANSALKLLTATGHTHMKAS